MFSTISTINSFLHINSFKEEPYEFTTIQHMFQGYVPSEITTSIYPNDSTLSGVPYDVISFSHNGYTVSASSCQRGGGLFNEYKSNFTYMMFDNNASTMWNCGANNANLTMDGSITNSMLHSNSPTPIPTSYDLTPYFRDLASNAPYRGGNTTNQYYRTFYDATYVDGEWFQIQFPKKFNMLSFTSVGGNSPARMPYKIRILGSNDGITWNSVNYAENPSLLLQTWTHNFTNTIFYFYYRFVTTNVTNRMSNNTAPVNQYQGHVQASNFTMSGNSNI